MPPIVAVPSHDLPYEAGLVAQALTRSGAIAGILPVLPAEAAHVILDRVDGICLWGQGDVIPGMFGPTRSLLAPVVGARGDDDMFEADLIRGAHARAMPILATGRGALMVAHVLGGVIAIDATERDGPNGHTVKHIRSSTSSDPAARVAYHSVIVNPDTKLAQVLGVANLHVNSAHRQRAETLPEMFSVSARAPDGTIEAYESTGNGWDVLAVQWRPELITHRDSSAARLYGFITDAAVAYAAGRRP